MLTTQLSPIEQYRSVGTVTAVSQADPHQLVMLLYDGAIAAVLQGKHALQTGDVATKASTISKALRIIDEGLRACLEDKGDPSMVANLRALYDHMINRLLSANLHGDVAALDEVARLLGELRSAWASIAPDRPDARADLHA